MASPNMAPAFVLRALWRRCGGVLGLKDAEGMVGATHASPIFGGVRIATASDSAAAAEGWRHMRAWSEVTGPLARKRLRLVLGGCLALLSVMALTLLGGYVYSRLAQIPVERVVFSGEMQHIPRQHLETLVNENLDGGFLTVDIERLRAPLERHPWVFKAVVKRRWPGALEINITEQTPIALWGEDSYLNHQGEVFTPPVYEVLPELPSLRGPDGSQLQLMQHYLFIREQIQELDLQVAALNMDVLGGLVAHLHNGSELVFGRGRLQEKMARFMGVYLADLEGRKNQIRSVDLRYRHGLAVSWRTG